MTTLNIDNSISYKTEDNLHKAIKNKGLAHLRYLTVCNREGRFTAVFPLTSNHVKAPRKLNLTDITDSSRNVFDAFHCGFIVLN
jgi:hypothetical protein